MSDDDEKKQLTIFDFIARALIILPLLIFVNWFWEKPFAIDLWKYWIFDQTAIQQALTASIPIFIWAAAVNTIVGCFISFEKSDLRNTNEILTDGFCISLFAGVVEEFLFRWLFLYSAMLATQICCFLFFGWISSWFELPRLLYQYIIQPIMELVSFGSLNWLWEYNWLISSSVVSANATFRDGHKYQGFFGWVNSWVIGFFLFWIMFTYGLPAAIVVHFTYDFIIYVIIFLHAKGRAVTARDDDNFEDIGWNLPRNPRKPLRESARRR